MDSRLDVLRMLGGINKGSHEVVDQLLTPSSHTPTSNALPFTVTEATLFSDLDPGTSGVETFTLSSNATNQPTFSDLTA